MAIEGFDAVKARDNLIAGLKKLGEEEGFSKIVLGVSGGKDSTVCAALCARAFGPQNVYGIMMPDGVQEMFLRQRLEETQRRLDVVNARLHPKKKGETK